MGEVVAFPGSTVQVEEPDDEPVIIDGINPDQMMRYYMVGELVQTVMPMIFGQLMMFDIDVTDDDSPVTRADGALMIEAFKAVMCRHLGLPHTFHKLSDELFVEDEASGMLKLVPEVNCNFSVYNEHEV